MKYYVVFLLPSLSLALIGDKDQIDNLPSEYWTAFINISYEDSKNSILHTERTETGRYSTATVKSVRGLAVELSSLLNNGSYDKSGCWPPFDRSKIPKTERWIAVVKRGKCQFNQKISNAISLNASGVLVYDNEDSGFLESMKVNRFNIPSVFTYQWKGQELIQHIQEIGKVYLSLQQGSHCRTKPIGGKNSTSRILYCTPPDTWDEFNQILQKQTPYWNWNATGGGIGGSHHGGSESFNVEKRTSVLFVSVSFIVLMIISLAWLVFYYVQRFRYMHAKDQLERKLCSQAKRALAIISTSVLKKDDLEKRDFFETCAVCIETYKVADVVRILPCKHQFHKSCIDQWLLEKRTCPMCKMDILKHYGLISGSGSGGDDSDNDSSREETVMNVA